MAFTPFKNSGPHVVSRDGWVPHDAISDVLEDLECRAESAAAAGEIERTAFLAKSRDSLTQAVIAAKEWRRAAGVRSGRAGR